MAHNAIIKMAGRSSACWKTVFSLRDSLLKPRLHNSIEKFTSSRSYHGICQCSKQIIGKWKKQYSFSQMRYFWQGRDVAKRDPHNYTENPGFKILTKPFAFSVLMCTGSFTGGMIWQYETIRYKAHKAVKTYGEWDINSSVKQKKFGIRSQINNWWNKYSVGQQLTMGIIGANVLVFLLWRIPRIQGTMLKYFSSTPFSGASSLSMVLSAFSQHNLLHLAANMYVLWSFAGVATALFGHEQFVGIYCSGAVLSCLASYFHKVARSKFMPSLGASGALMAILGAVCVSFPDARLAIAFIGDIIPHSFSADSALKAIVAFDLVGLLLGWKLFDHAAHLGGVFFGIWYAKYGKNVIWNKRRESVMRFWHSIRG